ncbi:MAG: ABC transporter, permease protein 2 (cluster 5, nickel/peptides/opines), partial [uncultured Microvirga sp.]
REQIRHRAGARARLHPLRGPGRARHRAVAAGKRVCRGLARHGELGGVHHGPAHPAELHRPDHRARDLDVRLGVARRERAELPRSGRAPARAHLGQYAVREPPVLRPGGLARGAARAVHLAHPSRHQPPRRRAPRQARPAHERRL